jgi:asparagine synthase (glutamine-hydrolysing)
MCGITGFWEARPSDLDLTSTLSGMLDTLHHRGPDGRGVHVDRERGLALGHARLSIIDLDTGDQPIRLEGRGLVLTHNGEFYDYKPIRARLATHGRRFSTRSDSEIALHLYDLHGLGFLEQLRGEFAFVLFDEQADELLLVRDRFGVKPLYYHADAHGLRWGSEVKALLEHPAVPRELDRRAAIHQMMQVMAPGTTAFRDVHALLPGHFLRVRRNGDRLQMEQHRYWDLDFPSASEHDLDADPAPFVEGVREHLIDAVRTRLEADVPVGCYLSGGIDSCSILGLATAMQQSPVQAFTISFDDAAYDEAAIAREMAESTRATQEELAIGAADLYGEHYRRTLWHAERTFYNTLGVAKWHMSRRVHELGYKVVVTGEGSDELFAGYPFLKRDHFRHGLGANGSAHLGAMDAGSDVFRGAILSEEETSHPAFDELLGFTPSWIQPWIVTFKSIVPLLSEELRTELHDYDPIRAIAESLDADKLRGRHPLDQVQYTWAKTMLEGQILTWGGDRVDMANSMESRPAFLDHHLAEYATRIPPTVRIRDGVEKWVLREAMKGVLPRTLYEREKFAFMAPPSHTDASKRAAADELIDAHLSPEQVRDAGLLDDAALSRFLEKRGRQNDGPEAIRGDIVVNHALGLHLLDQLFVRQNQPTAASIR